MSLLGVCVAAVCSLISAAPVHEMASPPVSEPFATASPASSTLRAPQKWLDARDAIEAEAACLAKVDGGCARGQLPGHLARWRAMDRQTQMIAVNHWVNQYDYDSDVRVWGQRDYWAPLSAFVARGKGDCEDFAIAKYTLLRAIGVAATDLRLVIVNETRRDVLHAVLSVRIGDNWQMLDNMDASPRNDTEVTGYVPVMQFSDAGAKYYAGIDPMTFVQPAARPRR